MALTNDEIRARLLQLLADMAAPAVPPWRVLVPGDNLPSLIANGPAEAIYQFGPGFTHVGQLRVSKPVALIGLSTLPDRRVTRADFNEPHIIGPIVGPVRLSGLLVSGLRGTNMLEAGDDTAIDRCFFTAPNGAHRGWLVNCRGFDARRSVVEGIWSDQDAQAVCGYDGTDSISINDCGLEASGENVLFGGAEPTSETRSPRGIWITNCDLTKRPEWLGDNTKQCKNLVELKNAHDFHMAKCRGEYSFIGGQGGYAIVLTVRNEKGGAPYSTIREVSFVDCTFKHIGACVQILALDDQKFGGVPVVSQRMQDVSFSGVTFEDFTPATWPGTGRTFYIARGPKNLTIQDVKTSGGGTPNTFIEFAGATTETCENLVIRRFDGLEGTYGIKSPEGLGAVALAARAPGATIEGITLHRTQQLQKPKYPAGIRVV